MTDTKILTDLVRGGDTVEFAVTARRGTNIDIETVLLDAQRKQVTAGGTDELARFFAGRASTSS